ncbi:MAG: cupin domain-containing protein [Syntrophorhabdaceae bacterium]|nr:cupin domain-containing protein [Syntrophorhabdaceae bacterium]
MESVVVERLPNTKDIDGAKWWIEERGMFAQIAYREEIRHLAFFEIKKGYFRGSHYHKKKEETFFVISGKIRALFRDIEGDLREEHILSRGDRVRVKTGCGHIFYALEDVLVVEYSPQIYEKEDTYYLEF